MNGAVIFFLLLFFSPLALSIYLFFRLRSQKKKCELEKQELEETHSFKISELRGEIRVMAEEYATETEALKTELEPLKQYAEIIDAEAESERIRKEARDWATQTKGVAQNKIDQAITEARQIVDQANIEAEQIAGSALDAKDKADLYHKAAVAMKNQINGYGDEYIIPNHNLIDDLAEDFGHKEAGIELKEARLYTKTMVRNQIAATCDYVEENRRITAIRFVLDAFNGKVDSILAKAKHDNYGKLKQAIDDAFHLVNQHGRAFREARVSPAYLQARQAELEWAVKVHELRKQEQEEQRRIREEIREEEKARREYERAIKAAAKEEKMLQKAMEQARKHFESANEEEKQKFQAELIDLQKKLQEAEEKNQRALSMAQQTKQGYVYVISNIGSFGENVFKIGMTRRLEPLDRVRELGDASVPFAFDVHALLHSDDAPKLENELHRRFSDQQVNKVNSRKEFFRVGVREIRDVVDTLGIEANWTMKAEAAEYRESLAIERGEHKELEVA